MVSSSSLVGCGLVTSAAIVGCLVYGQTTAFNMVMCVFCVLAMVSLWAQDGPQELEAKEHKKE